MFLPEVTFGTQLKGRGVLERLCAEQVRHEVDRTGREHYPVPARQRPGTRKR